MAEKLALLGGSKLIQRSFSLYNSFGLEEVQAATAVVQSGVLSKFVGAWGPDFFGGVKVQEFERAWEAYFKVPHAISVNSATSGLIAAIGALDVEPGDEIIVSPWTMCATATAILVWNAIPVFADIERETFGLDPAAVERAITPRTKAIVVTDIYGHAADIDSILKVAVKHGLKVIEDAAQAPGALYGRRHVGTLADIGVFSLNYHKHIHTGEGGVCVTRDARLAERMQLIRNHGEAVVGEKGVTDLSNMLGFNFRLGEIEAAIGLEQLKKLPRLIAAKGAAGAKLSQDLSGLQGLRPPVTKQGCTHVYYGFPMIVDLDAVHTSRDRLVQALRAEGLPAISEGYQNVHRLPLYQKRIAYGTRGFPWTSPTYKGDVSYGKGTCPVAEEFHDRSVVGFGFWQFDFGSSDLDLVAAAFRKVWSNLEALRL